VFNFLKNRTEKLYYSDAHFMDELLGPGWSWSDYNYYYSAEKSPFPMYGNVVRFTLEQIELQQIKSTPEGLAMSPPFFRTHIKEPEETEDGFQLFRGFDDNAFSYSPEADTTTYFIDRPFHYTPQLITKLLADTLDRPVEYVKMIKPDSVQTIYSISADTVFKRMMQPSDNFLAEQLLLLAASWLDMPLNSRRVIGYMKEHHLQGLPDEPQWVDGSGLSRYNMLTPRSVIHLLQMIRSEFNTDEELYELLAAGGESGTIRNWYASRDGGRAYVFAKTGTLSNNHCLSGFIKTRSGRTLIFSFMNNHYITPSSVVKREMEKVLWHIHEAY
jgi:D-alanyl-D-alanine carboxypeptidase/D-alanyl-D-alanine-endopeptidase (penicillin-binding protein 4)